MIDQFSYWQGKADCLKELGDSCAEMAISADIKFPETKSMMQEFSAAFYKESAKMYNKANEYINHQQSSAA